MVAPLNLKNKKFGRWLAIKPVKYGSIRGWECKCDCGNIRTIPTSNLTGVKTSKCRRCAASELVTHGMYKSRSYSIYNGMIQRCYNKNSRYYRYYGGRGISVFKEWIEDFKNFFNDMGNPPDGMSIDRIDNNLGYFKENCRWTTQKDQASNRSISILEGEISNGWIVVSRVKNEKKYNIKCLSCGFLKVKWSCGFRGIAKHKCDKEKKCQTT